MDDQGEFGSSAMKTKMSRSEKLVSSLAVVVILAGFAADKLRVVGHTNPYPFAATTMVRSNFAATAHLRRYGTMVAVGGPARAAGSLQ
jgi:hypothetical protein